MRPLGTTLATLLLLPLLAACGDETDSVADSEPVAEESPATASPTATPEPRSTRGDEADRGRSLRYQDVDVVGEWETGELLGERLPAGTAFGRPQVFYAVTSTMSEQGYAQLVLGLEQDGRIFRILPALVPETEEAPDGIDLYGGNLLESPDERDGSYELMGAVPGTVTVSIESPDGGSVEATSQSDAVLPGWTVFHHRAKWQPGWDELRLAPVVVTTDEGPRVEARERSWVG